MGRKAGRKTCSEAGSSKSQVGFNVIPPFDSLKHDRVCVCVCFNLMTDFIKPGRPARRRAVQLQGVSVWPCVSLCVQCGVMLGAV